MDSRPVTPGFHHVTLVSSAAPRTLAFYRDVLGLALVHRAEHSEHPGAPRLYLGAEGGEPGTLVCALHRPDAGRGKAGIGGVHHTAFGVGTDEALLKWKRRLVDLGWAVSGPYDRGYFTSIYFRDPDGQIMEMATAGPGYAIDEPADRLGGELMLPPQRIVRGHRDEAAVAALTHPDPVPEITPDMTLQGIHHISGITDDLERAGDFLEAALGLRLVKRTTNRDDPRQLHYFWGRYQGGEIAPHSSHTLFGWPDSWIRARPGLGQTQLVAFQAGEHDLDAWTDHLRSLDVEVSPTPEGIRYRGIRFGAPDGQLMEITRDQPE